MDIALLDALASHYFKSLTNTGNEWIVDFVDHEGNEGRLVGKNLDRLLNDWINLSEQFWSADYERRQEREMERRMLHG